MSSCNDAKDHMLMTINEITVSMNTQSLTSCHEALISHSTYDNSVIANTISANINTSSDNMLTCVAPTKLATKSGKSRYELCLTRICSNYISSTANNKALMCHNENTSCDSKWIIYVISCPICNLQYVGQSNNFRARMHGHRGDFRLYAAGKINKMDNNNNNNTNGCFLCAISPESS